MTLSVNHGGIHLPLELAKTFQITLIIIAELKCVT